MSEAKQPRPIPFSPPDITEAEIQEVCEVLRSGWITTGPRTKEFERQITAYTGASRGVALNSATAAMELTLRLLGIGPGDEVITSAYTYTASASVIAHVGATIRLVDVQEDSLEMDYDALSSAINEKTKAIIPVDIAGFPCDYPRIYEIVEEKRPLFRPATPLQEKIGRVVVMADAAHSFGAYVEEAGDPKTGNPEEGQKQKKQKKMAGNLADFSCFSFHAVKNLTTAEGGAALWSRDLGLDDEAIYHDYQLLSLHGQSKDALSKTKLGAWEYDIVYPGYKCNMTDIMAALGLVQLKRYPELLARREAIVAQYDQAFVAQGLAPLKHVRDHRVSSRHLYILNIPGFDVAQRNALITKLAEEGIATNVHYKPLPMMTAYQKLGFDIRDYPRAYAHYKNEITLPLHTLLTDEDVARIIEAVTRLRHEV